MTSHDRCPIQIGRKIKRPGRWFNRRVAYVGAHMWDRPVDPFYCYVPVQFRNGDYAILRWNMLDGNPMSSWDQTDEVVEIQSEFTWVNKGIRASLTMPEITECEPRRLVLNTTSKSHTWQITLIKAVGGDASDGMLQTDSDIAHCREPARSA